MLCQFQGQAKAETETKIEQENTMKTNTRFIRSIVKTARTTEVEMPWARGKRREAFIRKRGENAATSRKLA
jgi:hypothetical protein